MRGNRTQPRFAPGDLVTSPRSGLRFVVAEVRDQEPREDWVAFQSLRHPDGRWFDGYWFRPAQDAPGTRFG